ncbi:VOC family protein [Kribbella sp. NPDC051952]|uniref:VOC family protein n=1 Tax=Kribbella sp. NPDC051952 TaxID=3154851 RepID=UPI00342AB012
MDMLSGQAIQDAGVEDWRKLSQSLHGCFLVQSFADALTFVTAVGEACAAVGREPDVRLTGSFVEVRLLSPDAVYRPKEGPEVVGPSVTQADVDLARQLSAIAQAQGLTSDPASIAQVEIALDTADEAEIGPFWAAVLTGLPFQGVDVFDPSARLPSLWFQGTDGHETPRQRFHLDLWLPPEVVPARIEAALAAGGTITDDSEAPAFTVLADPQGNKVCLCTYLNRGTG